MFYQQDGGRVLAPDDAAQDVTEGGRLGGIEAGARLVEEEKVRIST